MLGARHNIVVCLIDANTGEIGRWLLRNCGLSMWRITREHIAIWNRYKMKTYCYDIENDVLRILPADFNAKKNFNDLVEQGNVPSWNVHFAMEYAKVEDKKLKVHLFISHYDFRGDYYEEVPMSEVIGKGKAPEFINDKNWKDAFEWIKIDVECAKCGKKKNAQNLETM